MEAKIDDSNVVQTTVTATEATAKEPTENAEVLKLKAALSKANSEAAANKRLAEDFKQQLREKQSEAERAEAERQEREKQREARIAELEARERVSTYKDKLMEAGIDPAAADLMAKSLPDGVTDDYFTAVKTFNANQRQAIETETLNKQPKLSVGTPPSGGSIRTEEDAKYDRWWGLS